MNVPDRGRGAVRGMGRGDGVSRPNRFRRLSLTILFLLCLGGAFAWIDRGSLQGGNRLFREGDLAAAAEIYRRHLDSSEGAMAAYNLGTSLLTSDPLDSESQLRRAAARGTASEVAQRARYNLGIRFLTAANAATEPDSTKQLLDQAVESNREALRIRLDDLDARWNLAVAQRMLDSLGHRPLDPEQEVTAGEDETRIDLTALVRSETGEGASGLEPDSPNPGEVFGERQTPRQGARESWTTQDPGPLDGPVARNLLMGMRDHPEQLVRGILWSHRPDVQWWQSAPYPGGGW